MKVNKRILVCLVATTCLAWLSACASAGKPATEMSALDKAAAEATIIVQQAQATALVLRAQSQATALISGAVPQAATPTPESANLATTPTQSFVQPLQTADLTLPAPALSTTPLAAAITESVGKVEIISVSFAAEGAYICVQYKAPPLVAQKWWQGMVAIKDEATGAIYDQIPVAPVIGPLIARPVQEGQLGYVMIVNEAPPLQSGARVTVKLGDYLFEHLPVQ